MAAPPTTLTFAVWGPIAREDLPGLCDRVCALLSGSGAGVAYCDGESVPADAVIRWNENVAWMPPRS